MVETISSTNDESSLAYLWNAKHMGREKTELDRVASVSETVANALPSAPLVVPQKVGHVLDQKKPWLMPLQYAYDVLEQIAPLWTVESKLLPCLGEWLAGKASAEDVVRRNLTISLADIAVRAEAEVFLVKVGEIAIDLRRKDAAVPKLN